MSPIFSESLFSAEKPPVAIFCLSCVISASSFFFSINKFATLSGTSSILDFSKVAVLSKIVSRSENQRRAAFWLTASILLTPPATADSDIILNEPISPVLFTWVPPQSSTDQADLLCVSSSPPIVTTLTSSPYFSPNSAIAPSAIAISGVMMRVSTGEFI